MKTNTPNKTTKHTPGPWTVNQAERTAGVAILGPDKDMVGSAFNRPVAESQANARLISASPELLEACKALLAKVEEMARKASAAKDMFPLEHPVQNILAYGYEAEYEQATAAIAKATQPS